MQSSTRPLPEAHESRSRILTRAALRSEVGLTVANATLLRWEAAGLFPRRFYLNEKMPVWWADEILAWLKAKSLETQSSTVTAAATEARRVKKSKKSFPVGAAK